MKHFESDFDNYDERERIEREERVAQSLRLATVEIFRGVSAPTNVIGYLMRNPEPVSLIDIARVTGQNLFEIEQEALDLIQEDLAAPISENGLDKLMRFAPETAKNSPLV